MAIYALVVSDVIVVTTVHMIKDKTPILKKIGYVVESPVKYATCHYTFETPNILISYGDFIGSSELRLFHKVSYSGSVFWFSGETLAPLILLHEMTYPSTA